MQLVFHEIISSKNTNVTYFRVIYKIRRSKLNYVIMLLFLMCLLL